MGFLFLPIQRPNESDRIVRELYFCDHPISITVLALEVCWSLLLLVLVVYLLPIHSFGSRNRYKSGYKWQVVFTDDSSKIAQSFGFTDYWAILIGILAEGQEKGQRVAAATLLKNFLKKQWTEEGGTMSAKERCNFRNQLVEVLLCIDGLVLKQLAEAVCPPLKHLSQELFLHTLLSGLSVWC